MLELLLGDGVGGGTEAVGVGVLDVALVLTLVAEDVDEVGTVDELELDEL